jgi:hypothetical protein
MSTIVLSNAEREWLAYVSAGHRNGFAGMFSGRTFRKQVAEQLVKRGLLARVELQPANTDGHILWGRAARIGYALPDKAGQS